MLPSENKNYIRNFIIISVIIVIIGIAIYLFFKSNKLSADIENQTKTIQDLNGN